MVDVLRTKIAAWKNERGKEDFTYDGVGFLTLTHYIDRVYFCFLLKCLSCNSYRLAFRQCLMNICSFVRRKSKRRRDKGYYALA